MSDPEQALTLPERSRDHLFKPGEVHNRNGSLPAWRRALLAAVEQDGGWIWQRLALLAAGRAVQAPDVDDNGKPNGKMRVIRPSAHIMLAAQRELLDRAFGKPVQTVITTATENPDAALLSGFTSDEIEQLRAIARARALRADVPPDKPYPSQG